MNGPRTERTARDLALIALVVLSASCASQPKPETSAQPADQRANSRSDVTIDTRKNQQDYASVADYIQGNAPGVQVLHSTDGTVALRIRGLSSPSGVVDPLIVIDGMPSGQPGTRALDGLNPRDILRIEVLKDAASTAMYGLRGGSGVILITTRKK
jgi:TonB-dependent SusC/RagA subfamily outer membrane receptor